MFALCWNVVALKRTICLHCLHDCLRTFWVHALISLDSVSILKNFQNQMHGRMKNVAMRLQIESRCYNKRWFEFTQMVHTKVNSWKRSFECEFLQLYWLQKVYVDTFLFCMLWPEAIWIPFFSTMNCVLEFKNRLYYALVGMIMIIQKFSYFQTKKSQLKKIRIEFWQTHTQQHIIKI